jgi:hypothetical protein
MELERIGIQGNTYRNWSELIYRVRHTGTGANCIQDNTYWNWSVLVYMIIHTGTEANWYTV